MALNDNYCDKETGDLYGVERPMEWGPRVLVSAWLMIFLKQK